MAEINSCHFAVEAGAGMVETTSGHEKMTLHAVLAAALCFQVVALCICCSHWSPCLAAQWLFAGAFQWPYAWEAHQPQFPPPGIQPNAADAIVTSSIE